MAGKRNSRWKDGNTRYPKVTNGKPTVKQHCTGRQYDELVRAGTAELSNYREEEGWRHGARVFIR
jgi:hypothetical protein